jgi:hypothetical protein
MGTDRQQASGAEADEFRRFARYLLAEEPGGLQVRLYERAVDTLPAVQVPHGDALLRAARSPILIPLLDAGTSFLRLDCLFRRRLMLATAILEASPRHADRFLPCTTSLAQMFLLGAWTAARLLVTVPVGVLLVRLLHRP